MSRIDAPAVRVWSRDADVTVEKVGKGGRCVVVSRAGAGSGESTILGVPVS